MPHIDIHTAKIQLSRLVDAAVAGTEIVITRAGTPVARLVPLTPPAKPERRRLSILNGKLQTPADFDAPLSDDELDRFETP
jgi:prevent-host-death family protein